MFINLRSVSGNSFIVNTDQIVGITKDSNGIYYTLTLTESISFNDKYLKYITIDDSQLRKIYLAVQLDYRDFLY